MILEDCSSLEGRQLGRDCVIVVGAGAVGIHLAVQMARRGRQVVVLEAGDNTLQNFSPQSFKVIGRKHEGIAIGRSVALGGASNLWGGQLIEFGPIDFEGRAWLPNSRWPVGYDDLRPYFAQTYEALGVLPQYIDDAEVWRGIHREPPRLSNGAEVFLTRWMNRPNLAVHYDRDLKESPYLIVALGGRVTGFVCKTGRVSEVEFVGRDGVLRKLSGSDVVLAAGTIENSRLLLHASEQVERECPWRDNDNVGRYFQDHLGGGLAWVRPRNAKAFYDVFCTVVLGGQKFQPKVRLCDDALRGERLFNCQAMIAFESSVRENLIFLKQFVKAAVFSRKIGSITGLLRNIIACSRHLIPLMWKFVVEHRILIPSGSRISLIVQAEVEPLHDSRILIDPSDRDQWGLPKALLDWKVSGRELPSILEFTQRISSALSMAGLADLDIHQDLLDQRPEFLDTLRDTNHQSGGCVMGDSEDNGVVDQNLRVFGTENFFVAGPSVFRSNGNANVTFTAMALATRLAEHLAEAKARSPVS